MREIVRNIRVSEIPNLIAQLGFSPEQEVNLTIEESSEDILSIMDRVGKKAKERGLTEDKLAELLADESRSGCHRYQCFY
jgi:hypothetical protein